jgi:hypothetical protein
VNSAAARAEFEELTARWGRKYRAIVRLWDNAVYRGRMKALAPEGA